MSELSERLCLNLTYPLTGYVKLLADFFKSSGSAVVQAKSQTENLFLSRRERTEDIDELFLKQSKGRSVRRSRRIVVTNKVTQMTVLFFAYRRFKRYGLLRNL